MTKTIVIYLYGGLITGVSGVPADCELRVEDYDITDDELPGWDAEKGCLVTIYEGDAD